MEENQYRFQVNLGGMIEILSDHLYSSPDVFIRELLQNGVDAITGRAMASALPRVRSTAFFRLSVRARKEILRPAGS